MILILQNGFWFVNILLKPNKKAQKVKHYTVTKYIHWKCSSIISAHSAWALEYADCISAEELDTIVLNMALNNQMVRLH